MSTGIVRRLDELGRIVIPIEMRRSLRIREGELVQIALNGDSVNIRKHSVIGSVNGKADKVADDLNSILRCSILISDLDTILTAAGAGASLFQGKHVSLDLQSYLIDAPTTGQLFPKERMMDVSVSNKSFVSYGQAIVPVLYENSIIGAIVALNLSPTKAFTDETLATLQFAARQFT